MANRLASETSLYLRQHANNPVDWYPWSAEAIAQARKLDRPIFLSIGYSACHWCHVMEHESFEKPAIADLMNQHFVCIKVDREERPDIDDIYMKSVQLLNQGQGGWPMSVWLTPDLQPFFAGTYYPPNDRYGRPGFPRLLTAIATAWRERRSELLSSAQQITDHLKTMAKLPASAGVSGDHLLENAGRYLRQTFDPEFGGFGRAPKFPHALELRVLLRNWLRFGDADALAMARTTLDHMARGGMYDQLAGGFHRYSVDERWLVPHFEKMLYDQALLVEVYLEAFQATGNSFYRQIVEETLDFVLNECTSSAGGFYSSHDADSEGEEGKFFVWSKNEIESILSPELCKVAIAVWGISATGNFEGHNILHRTRSDEADARALGMPLLEFREKLSSARKFLLQKRELRIKPGRDEKILTSWNGLMIAAMARAGSVLNNEKYIAAARAAADFVLLRLRTPSGRLLRTCGEDSIGKLEAYLEDYAFFAEALVHLYEATFDEKYLRDAAGCAEMILAHFIDAENGGFFATIDDHEQLILRPKDVHDGSTPSGNAKAVTVLLKLGRILGRNDFVAAGDAALKSFQGLMESHPSAAGQMLIAYDFWLGPIQEVVIVGNEQSTSFSDLVQAARTAFAPRRMIAAKDDRSDSGIPWFAGRSSQGAATLYLCENMTCRAPLMGAEALAALSDAAQSPC